MSDTPHLDQLEELAFWTAVKALAAICMIKRIKELERQAAEKDLNERVKRNVARAWSTENLGAPASEK